MMNMKKKMISLLLVLALVVGICPAAFAGEENAVDYAAMADKAAEHLAHLSLYYPELASETPGDTQLGQRIFAYVLQEDEVVQSDYCYIPVLRNGSVIALADYDLNGSGLVGMSINLVDGINAYLSESDAPFAILWDDRTPYLCTAEGLTCLEQTACVAAYCVGSAVFTQNMTFNDITAVANVGNAPEDMKIVVADEQSIARTTVSVTVPAINQITSDRCWAACVASVGQQQTGIKQTAAQVALATGIIGGASPSQVAAVLQTLYNVDAFSTGSPYLSTIIEKLNAKKPLIFGLKIAIMSTSGHMVVVYSFSGNPGSGTIGYMDPWNGTFETAEASKTGEYHMELFGTSYTVFDSVQIQ